ncbi:MAG TPA: TIGR02677 family protein [Paenisporosarcina sp.]|nr:TIGR02677 family protein [Paenisporosarcina sp.]
MQERFSKIKEATYLATDKSSTYRAILRHFYLQHERMKEFLLPQEVFDHIKSSSYFEDYTIDELHIDLAALVKWGNLNAQQESGNAKTIEEYKKKRFRYQCTPYTVEFERMLMQFEQSGDTFGGSLEKTQFEKLYKALSKLKTHADASPEDCASYWDDILTHFKKIGQNTSDYFAYIRSEDANERMKSESFLLYKDQFTTYLRDFILSSQKTAAHIQELMLTLPTAQITGFFQNVVTHQSKTFRLEDISVDPMQELLERWDILKRWFVTGDSGESQFEYLQQQTDEQIRRITRIVQRLGERNQQFRSRKEDYLHLAKWFDAMEDVQQAHKLSAVAFGVFYTKHFHSDHEPTDDIYTDVWDEQPMDHETQPRIQQYREKTRASAMGNNEEKKQQAKQRHMEQRQLEQTLIEQYISNDEIQLAHLPIIESSVRKMLLSWIGKAMLRKDQKLKTEFGTVIHVTIHEDERTQLQSPDGVLEMPNVTIQFERNEVRV